MHSASPRDEQEKYLRLSQYTPKLDNLLKKLFYDTLITYVLICACAARIVAEPAREHYPCVTLKPA